MYGEGSDFSELYGLPEDDDRTPLPEPVGRQGLTGPEIRIEALDAALRITNINPVVIGPGNPLAGFLELARTIEDYISDGGIR